MKRRKKIIIIFPDQHIAYSPTTLQLNSELNKFFNSRVFCFETNVFHKIDSDKVAYAKRLFGIGRLLIILKKIFPFIFKLEVSFYYKKLQLQIHLFFNKYDEYIYVDPISIALSGSMYKKGTLLSLELTENTVGYLKFIDNNKIKNLIIQNKERKDVYFKNLSCDTFFIQNSPSYKREQVLNFLPKKKKQLVFGGTASLGFGIISCLDFVNIYTHYTLVIKGNIPLSVLNMIKEKYFNELQSNTIILKNNYQNDEDYLIDLSENYIGFAFYDLSYEEINNINYITGPSGKMFKYFAAGVPVIASNLQGFMPVQEFNAGILINELNHVSILEAIKKIENNYNYYQENCYRAAEFFNFEKSVNVFIQKIND